ncbi:MAG: hypothetical protein WC025_04370 [Candidatus Magasanikbacteria bacterium]
MSYLKFNELTIQDFSSKNINTLYNKGYVFTRMKKGMMNQTRSLRIDLSQFELSSENRRILRKLENLNLEIKNLPLLDYHWSIGKLAKDFYETKFGEKVFSANKIKEILTTEQNFNKLFVYKINETEIGYCIVHETNKIIHYSYPFYNLEHSNSNLGMSMMLKAIIYSQENKKKYIYLGSAQRPTDIYKLQFKGLEWFDGDSWTDNIDELKKKLKDK